MHQSDEPQKGIVTSLIVNFKRKFTRRQNRTEGEISVTRV